MAKLKIETSYERAFWQQVFIATMTVAIDMEDRSKLADKAVEELRLRCPPPGRLPSPVPI